MTNPLKKCRDDRELSQAEMGKLLDVDEMTISRWERGLHLPAKRHWPVIEERLGISPAQLIAGVLPTEAGADQ